MAIENKELDIIDITLLLRQRRCRECVDEELDNQGIGNLYYCDVEVIYENNKHILLPFVVNRRNGRIIDVMYDEKENTVQAHIIPQ